MGGQTKHPCISVDIRLRQCEPACAGRNAGRPRFLARVIFAPQRLSRGGGTTIP